MKTEFEQVVKLESAVVVTIIDELLVITASAAYCQLYSSTRISPMRLCDKSVMTFKAALNLIYVIASHLKVF